METDAATWPQELAAIRQRADALRAAGALPDPLRRAEGEASFARLREIARALFSQTIEAFQDLCPAGYPAIDDNDIAGTGGAVGIRFDEHHSFFFALERVKVKTKSEGAPKGLSSRSEPVRKRMPGDPLPPVNPDEPVRLAMTALRWDEQTGWSEMRRVLDPRWDERLLREHLAAYLTGVIYDLTVATHYTKAR